MSVKVIARSKGLGENKARTESPIQPSLAFRLAQPYISVTISEQV